MSIADFYFRGVSSFDLKIVPEFDKIKRFINEHLIKFDENTYDWVELYPGVFDLRGSEDEQLFQMISDTYLETDFCSVISEITGLELTVGDCVLRLNINSRHSYMPKHRDTYKRADEVIGRIQPLIKLAYFPEQFKSDKKVFSYYEGTQLRYFKNGIVDRLSASMGKKVSFKPDDNKLVIFNSFGYHMAHAADWAARYSPRLLINLCQESQVSSFSRRN